METISHMGILGRKCACNRKVRKIHHGAKRTSSHEGITLQKELPLKLKLWHDQLIRNIDSGNTKASSLLTVINQISYWFL